MMPIFDIHRIESAETSAATLGERRVNRVADNDKAPTFRKGRDELHGPEANLAAAHVEAVESAVLGQRIEDARTLVEGRCRADAVGAVDRPLDPDVVGQGVGRHLPLPQLLAGFRVKTEEPCPLCRPCRRRL